MDNTKKLLIILAVVVVVAVVSFLLVKHEGYNISSTTGLVAASGTASAPVTSLSYLTADASGNLSVNTNGYFDNLNVNKQLSLNGYSGNPGDIMVSNGSSTPPVWSSMSGMMRYLTAVTYTPSSYWTNVAANASLPFSSSANNISINNVTPNKNLLVTLNTATYSSQSGQSNTLTATLSESSGSVAGTVNQTWFNTKTALGLTLVFVVPTGTTGGTMTLSFANGSSQFQVGPFITVTVFEIQ